MGIEAAAESAPPMPSSGKAVDLTSVVAEVSLGGGVMIRVYRREGGRG